MNWVSSRRQAKRSVCAMVLGLGCWALAKPAFSELRMNEFLAVNNRGLADGDASNWIEIYNPGTETLPLGGWSLTDDTESPNKWIFPDIVLGHRRHLVVFASGKNRGDASELHTNFKLNNAGEYLGLFRPDEAKVVSEFSPAYPRQHRDISFGHGAGENREYFDKPTPSRANGGGFAGFVADTKFKPGRGFYAKPFRVSLTTAMPSATIRYTTDDRPAKRHPQRGVNEADRHRHYRLQRSETALGLWQTVAEHPAPPNGGPTSVVLRLARRLAERSFSGWKSAPIEPVPQKNRLKNGLSRHFFRYAPLPLNRREAQHV